MISYITLITVNGPNLGIDIIWLVKNFKNVLGV